jgi:hypothetical protein
VEEGGEKGGEDGEGGGEGEEVTEGVVRDTTLEIERGGDGHKIFCSENYRAVPACPSGKCGLKTT